MIFESGHFVLAVLIYLETARSGSCNLIGGIYFKDFVDILRFGSEMSGEVLLNIEVVLVACVGKILVVRMLRDVVLVRHERTHTAKLQNTLAAVQNGELVHCSKVFAQLLIIEGVRNLSAAALTGIERIDGLLAKGLVQFLSVVGSAPPRKIRESILPMMVSALSLYKALS